jgi:hypothetical protein
LYAARRALAFGHDLDLPALQVGIAGVHAQEIPGEEGRLIAAGAGADFEDSALLVRLVLGQQHEAQGLGGLFQLLPRPGQLLAGEGPHLGIGILQHGLEPREVLFHGAVGPDRRHDVVQLGQFARERHDGLGIGRGVERRRHNVVTGQDGVQAVRGRRNRHQIGIP